MRGLHRRRLVFHAGRALRAVTAVATSPAITSTTATVTVALLTSFSIRRAGCDCALLEHRRSLRGALAVTALALVAGRHAFAFAIARLALFPRLALFACFARFALFPGLACFARFALVPRFASIPRLPRLTLLPRFTCLARLALVTRFTSFPRLALLALWSRFALLLASLTRLLPGSVALFRSNVPLILAIAVALTFAPLALAGLLRRALLCARAALRLLARAVAACSFHPAVAALGTACVALIAAVAALIALLTAVAVALVARSAIEARFAVLAAFRTAHGLGTRGWRRNRRLRAEPRQHAIEPSARRTDGRGRQGRCHRRCSGHRRGFHRHRRGLCRRDPLDHGFLPRLAGFFLDLGRHVGLLGLLDHVE